jgi:hypothetical protein
MNPADLADQLHQTVIQAMPPGAKVSQTIVDDMAITTISLSGN